MTDFQPDPMPAADLWAATEAIRTIKARYFRYMDTRDWDRMYDIFTEDAVMDMRSEMESLHRTGLPVDLDGGLIQGRTQIVPTMAQALEGTVTVHHGHMPEIEILSPGEATGIWGMEDIVLMPPGAPCRMLHGYGHYHERYRRSEAGVWQIASLRLTRLHVEVS